MTQTLRQLETDLGPLVDANLSLRQSQDAARGQPYLMAIRNELSVNFTGQQVPIDKVARCTTETEEWFISIQMKLSFSDKVLEQALMLIGLCDYIIIAVQPSDRVSLSHEARRRRARGRGVGVWYAHESGTVEEWCVARRLPCDSRRIAKEFARHDGTFDAPSGAASAKRMTQTRSQYHGATQLLKSIKTIDGAYGWLNWKSIQRELEQDGFVQSTTPAHALRDAKREIWRGVEWKENPAPCLFRYSPKGAKQ